MTDEKKLEELKDTLKLPKDNNFAWSLITGAHILYAVGLLITLEGLGAKDFLTQLVMFTAAVATFCLGGYYHHSYHRWFLKQLKH